MFLQPTLAGEDTYFDGDDDDDGDDNGDPSYAQNDAPGSPDTFFFVQPLPSPSQPQPQPQMQSPAQAYAQSYVQTLNHSNDCAGRPPLASDSSQTPPSPVVKQRRSIQRPSLSNHNTLKRTSNAHTGHNSNQHTSPDANLKDSKNANKNDKRTQSLNALPQKTLIHLLQIKEEERKRAKNLLKSALSQLEVEVEKGDLLGARIRELEDRVERVQREKGGELGVDALKEMLAEQKGRVNGGAEVEGLKLKLSNTETELQRVKEEYRAIKIERDDSDRALVRARALAREMKEKAILIQAREQGRQEGFEEGLKQGRLLEEGGSTGEPSRSGRPRPRRSRERSTNPKSSSRRNTNPVIAEVAPSQASLEAEAAIRSIAERENERVRLQLKDVERELDAERQRLKEVEREKVRVERLAKEERERRDEREKEKEKEREKERAKERTKEREREASQAKEREKEREMRDAALKKQVDERARLQRAKERLELEKEKIREQMEKEKQDAEKKLTEARKEKEKLEKLLKEEKEKAVPLPYVPMAPPPRPSSSAARASEAPRRSSIDSYTSQASTIHFDMLQLPTGERGSGLSVIHEDVSGGRASPSVNSASGSAAPPPAWFTNPPIDYGKNANSTPNGPYPNNQNQADYLSPPENDNNSQSLRRSTASSSSYEFVIVPPSRPPSVVGGRDPESNNPHNAHNTHHSNPEDPHFLSPNHRPIQLPQTQTQTRPESPAARPTPPRYGDTSGVSTRPNSPVGLTGTVDVNGSFPPGFVPQTITDARGRSTPITVGGGFIPPSPSGGGPSGGGGLERSGTPAPIYGNPIAREREKKREEAESAATPPQSPSSHSPVADWSAPLAALHPPIFPVTGHQQPFQHPPPGSWVGGSSTTNDRSRNEHSPVLSTKRFKPGQTSESFEGGGTTKPRNQGFSSAVIPTQPLAGGGAWGAPRRPPSGFGGGVGSTPGPRSQDLPPVIPNPTVGGGGWGTHSRPPSGFGGGSMTPGPRDQDLPPVIPNPTVGGGGWSTRPPSGFGGGGMTPGTRSQDLPPVIPNSTMSGGWSTPNRPPGGMTPGPRNQDLPPVIPNPTTGGGGWSTPSRGFGGGGTTPGPRNQDLPPVIPNPTVGGGGWSSTPSRPPSGFGGSMTPGPRSQDLPSVVPNSTMGGWTPSRPPLSFGGGGGGGGGMTPGSRNQELPPVIPNPTVGGGWGTGTFVGGTGSTPRPRSQELPPVIPNPTMGGGWSSPNASHNLGAGGMTPGPRSQDLPPVIPNSTMGGGWTPNRATGSFGAGAGSTPGPKNQDLPTVGDGGSGSPFQPNFSIYGPPTNGSRSSSPYPNGEGAGEDGDTDPITALNTKMNATLGMDVGPSTGAGGGGRGGKAGKKGKKKR